MGEFPNKATQFKSGPKLVKIARKGGQSRSPKKLFALRLNALKKTGKTNEQIQLFVERLQDPNENVFHIQKLLDDFIEKNPKDMYVIQAIQTLIMLHKANFGERLRTENINLNINVDYDIEKAKEHLRKFI